MANFFENKDRRVIPNWRSFKRTAMLGELDVSNHSTPKPDVSFSIEDYKVEFIQNRSIPHAGDLLSAAIVNGFETDKTVIEAANFVLSNSKGATKTQISIAERITFGQSGNNNHINLKTYTISDCENYIKSEQIWEKIHSLKGLSREFHFNPIVWVELSRLYSIIGQQEQSVSSMKVALHLAPENRFVLRSAVRLFARYDELEFSHDIVRKNRLTNFDPWLTSAEISLATLRGRNSRFIKRGIEMVSSMNYSPFSFTELASSIGTVEILNGSNKKSRLFFQKALIAPNDNALAQIEWASKIDDRLELNLDDFQVKCNFEANALDNFNKNNLQEAQRDSFHWFLDMPFSKRPVLLGSHISGLLDDRETERDFLKAGLLSHPNDPQLLNNLVYSLALENKIDEAMSLLNRLEKSSLSDTSTKICLTATRGLIFFRKGFPDLGRESYITAIQDAKDSNSEYYSRLAILNYVREELLIKSDLVPALMDTVAMIPDNAKETDVRKLRKEVVNLYQQSKM